jgi:hypothetical protein
MVTTIKVTTFSTDHTQDMYLLNHTTHVADAGKQLSIPHRCLAQSKGRGACGWHGLASFIPCKLFKGLLGARPATRQTAGGCSPQAVGSVWFEVVCRAFFAVACAVHVPSAATRSSSLTA